MYELLLLMMPYDHAWCTSFAQLTHLQRYLSTAVSSIVCLRIEGDGHDFGFGTVTSYEWRVTRLFDLSSWHHGMMQSPQL